MQGGTEDIEEHIMSLHTEMCESGEVRKNMIKPAALRDTTAHRENRRTQEPSAAQQHPAADTMKEVAERQQMRNRQQEENLQNNRRMKT